MSVRPGVTTIDSSNYINDAIAGNILLGQGWSGDMRRIVQARKKQGDMTAVLPSGVSEVWADNWCIPANAPHAFHNPADQEARLLCTVAPAHDGHSDGAGRN